jgi:hypothetical protein
MKEIISLKNKPIHYNKKNNQIIDKENGNKKYQ